jgi:hypothetical protein
VGAIAVAKDTAAMEADIGRAVESRVLEEVSNRIATQSSSVQAAAQRAVAAMQAKADSLSGVVGVLGFALVGVAGVAEHQGRQGRRAPSAQRVETASEWTRASEGLTLFVVREIFFFSFNAVASFVVARAPLRAAPLSRRLRHIVGS